MLMFDNSRSKAGALARKQPRQRRAEDTVATILEAAAHIFAARGYARATTNHVATRAGVSIGSLYQYFPNKAALASAIEAQHLDEVAPGLLALARRLRAARVKPAAWARAFVRAVVAANDQPLHLSIYGVVPRTPATQRKLEEIVDALAGELAPLVRGKNAALRARIAVVAALTLVHELVIAMAIPQRPMAVREVSALVSAYLRA
jgi:AcrR family transcriptional regulator